VTGWDDDKLLISAISTVNPKLGYYALRLVDVDADKATELPVEDEATLGAAVIELGTDIQRRAAARAGGGSIMDSRPPAHRAGPRASW
jgi:hypothetical protein